MGIIALFLITIIGLVIFVVIDTMGLPDKEGVAEVIARNHSVAWTEIQYHSDGRGGMYPVSTYHPDEWSIEMRMGVESCCVSVDINTFASAKTGTTLPVIYRHGRYSGLLYITEVFSR